MTKRSDGTGTVNQLPSGRWRVRVRGADGAQHSLGTYDTEAEARAVNVAAVNQLAAVQLAPTGPKTLRTWGHTWLGQRETDGVRGIVQEKSVWARHVARHSVADLPLRELTRRLVLAWLKSVRDTEAVRPSPGGTKGKGKTKATGKPVSRRVVLHALHLVRGAVRAAVDAGHMRDDVTAGVVPPRDRGDIGDPWTFLTAAEVLTVAGCEKIPDPERTIYTVAIYTGLRRGELWGLRWTDVVLDGDGPEVTVRRSNKGTTKTRKVRRVPLLPEARAALEGIPRTSEWVFPGPLNGQRSKDDDARWAPQARKSTTGKRMLVNGYRERAGLTRRVRFHDLRHTCASHLLMGTWGVTLSLPEVAQWLGHSSVTMTERYAHLAPDRLSARVSGALERVSRVSETLRHETHETLRAQRDLNPQPSDPKSQESARKRMGNTAVLDSLVSHAVAVLRGAALRELPAELVTTLARGAILGGFEVPLALDAMHTGEGAARAAVDLAVLVLDGARAGSAEQWVG